jgi:hypothetical protein
MSGKLLYEWNRVEEAELYVEWARVNEPSNGRGINVTGETVNKHIIKKGQVKLNNLSAPNNVQLFN